MRRLASTLLFVVTFAFPALAQQQARQNFIFTCKVLDAVSVDLHGKVVRSEALTKIATEISPLRFETLTGRLTSASGPVRNFKIVTQPSVIEGLSAFEVEHGVNSILHIRTDIPGNRFLLLSAGTEVFSGYCETTPG